MKYRSLLIAAVAAVAALSCGKEPEVVPDVFVPVPVESITLSLPELSDDGYVVMTEGDYLTVDASVLPVNATDTLEWSLRYSDVAYIIYSDEDPLNHSVTIAAVRNGATDIFVKASGVEEVFSVFVDRPVVPLEKIILDVDEITITDDQSVEINYSFYPEDATGVEGYKWTISDEDVVEYSWDEGGTYYVDAVGPGTATVTCSLGDISASCKITVVSSYKPVTSIKANSVQVKCYDAFSVPVVVLPSDATTKGFTFVVADPTVISFEGIRGMQGDFIALKEGETKVTVVSKDYSANKQSSFTVTVIAPAIPEGAVDLGYRVNGMPIYFRKANLGATAEIDAGFLYAWGDTEPYYYSKNPYTWRDGYEDGYTLENYKWYDSATKQYTKYKADGTMRNYLLPEDDAAHKVLGGQWYVPTANEILFLHNECTWKQETRSGIHGMVFTSRVSGYEGNSVFLPCGGYMNGNENYADGNFERWDGKRYYMGCYQTSNILSDDDSKIVTFDFYDGGIYARSSGRWVGESIRPIWRGYAD